MLAGNILTTRGWLHGQLHACEGRIVAIEGVPKDPLENDDPFILPGFIDLHAHGGGGADVMEGGDAAITMARLHARYGTTGMLATTMTAPHEELRQVLFELGNVLRERADNGARILGVHLEGPYINPHMLGAQPDAAVSAALEEVLGYLDLAPIRVITLAPEISGHMAVIRALAERGVRVQIGHTKGSYEEGVAALKEGAAGFTHLFNAMSPLHHRAPGMVGAALAHAEYAEIIPDLLHVHPGAIHTALRAIPRVYAVSDSTAATGMPDGHYHLGCQSVSKCLGAVRLADGTLAGSTLTLDQALRNFVALGLPLAEASHRLSRHAADFLGLSDRGRIAVGAWADLVVLQRDLTLNHTFVEGDLIVKHAQ